MNCNQNCGCSVRMPGVVPPAMPRGATGGQMDGRSMESGQAAGRGRQQEPMMTGNMPCQEMQAPPMMPRGTASGQMAGTGQMPAREPMRGQMPTQGWTGEMGASCGMPMGGERGWDRDRFPVGMGYVPMQGWETPYSMDRGFRRGTIFPSLDYPFVMGRCRR